MIRKITTAVALAALALGIHGCDAASDAISAAVDAELQAKCLEEIGSKADGSTAAGVVAGGENDELAFSATYTEAKFAAETLTVTIVQLYPVCTIDVQAANVRLVQLLIPLFDTNTGTVGEVIEVLNTDLTGDDSADDTADDTGGTLPDLDPDADGVNHDGVVQIDNCPEDANTDQADADEDEIGDVCDMICITEENCDDFTDVPLSGSIAKVSILEKVNVPLEDLASIADPSTLEAALVCNSGWIQISSYERDGDKTVGTFKVGDCTDPSATADPTADPADPTADPAADDTATADAALSIVDGEFDTVGSGPPAEEDPAPAE